MEKRPKPPLRKIVVETSPTAPLEDDQYSTHDLHTAAYLSAIGVYLADVRHDGTRCSFVFADRSACLDAAKGLHNEQDDQVQASVLFDALRKIKGLAMRGGF